ELPSGATVRFMNTHLDHRRDPQERLASAAQIERLIEARPDVPSILIGDLNATPESEVLKRFRQAWQFAGDGETLWTSPSRVPRRQIDYIAFRPADRWQVREVYVIDEPIASDHRPIFALLELVAA